MPRRAAFVLLLSLSCFPAPQVHRICTTEPCPLVDCTCNGATFKASHCTTSCEDQATTCADVCSGNNPSGSGRAWAAGLTTSLGEFFAVASDDSAARDLAVQLCGRGSGPTSSPCENGTVTEELEQTGQWNCTASVSVGSDSFQFTGGSADGLTGAKSVAISKCIDERSAPGKCGLLVFACERAPQ